MHRDVENYKKYADEYKGLDQQGKTILLVDKKKVVDENDDAFHLIGGRTGAGKSTLAHHLHDLWTTGSPSTERVSLDRDEFPAKAQRSLNEEDVNMRVTHYDEANVSKREAMGKFNRDLLTFYFSIRGKKCFHVWCNPSIDIIDRPFIEERVNGLWYVFKRPKGNYIFIPRRGLLNMLDRGLNLKQDSIERHGHKYALIKKGRFKQYPQNDFKVAYDALKERREEHVANWFKEKYDDGKKYSERKAAKALNIGLSSFRKYTEEMMAKGLLEKNAYRSPLGIFSYDDNSLIKVRDYIKDVVAARGGKIAS